MLFKRIQDYFLNRSLNSAEGMASAFAQASNETAKNALGGESATQAMINAATLYGFDLVSTNFAVASAFYSTFSSKLDTRLDGVAKKFQQSARQCALCQRYLDIGAKHHYVLDLTRTKEHEDAVGLFPWFRCNILAGQKIEQWEDNSHNKVNKGFEAVEHWLDNMWAYPELLFANEEGVAKDLYDFAFKAAENEKRTLITHSAPWFWKSVNIATQWGVDRDNNDSYLDPDTQKKRMSLLAASAERIASFSKQLPNDPKRQIALAEQWKVCVDEVYKVDKEVAEAYCERSAVILADVETPTVCQPMLDAIVNVKERYNFG